MSRDLATLRYPVCSEFPPMGNRGVSPFVRVTWAGWEGVAVRVHTVKRGKRVETWHQVTASGRVDPERFAPAGALDRRGNVIEGLERPSTWQPVEPTKWKGPLPDPVPTVEPQMWSSRQRFQAVDDAEAADLAREMEADREAARSQRRAGDGGVRGQRRQQWWLDASLIRYAPQGKISKRSAEGRIMRALAPGIRDRFVEAGMGPTTLGAAQAETEIEESVVPFKQSPKDLADELVALGWFSAVSLENLDLAEVLMLAADQRALSWRNIAGMMQIGKADAATGLYAHAISKVHAIANGAQTIGVVERERQLAALRERNRAAKGGRS